MTYSISHTLKVSNSNLYLNLSLYLSHILSTLHVILIVNDLKACGASSYSYNVPLNRYQISCTLEDFLDVCLLR